MSHLRALSVVLATVLLPAAARAADGPLDRAADLARAGRCAEALPVLDAIPPADPLAAPALYLKADCLEKLGRGAEAAGIWDALAARTPESAPAAELRARAAAARAAALAASASRPGGAAASSRPAGAAVAAVDTELPPPPVVGAGEHEGYYPATYAGYIVAAAGGIMAVTGGLFAGLAHGREKDLEDLALNGSRDPLMPGEPVLWDESLARIEREGRLYARLSVALVIAGGALLAGGAAIAIAGVPRAHPPEPGAVDVDVEPTPGGIKARLGVHF